MGTSRSAAEMSGKVLSAARALPKANREATFEAGLAAKDVFVAGIRKAGGTPGSKWEGTRGRTGAGFDVKGYQHATAIVGMRGPVHLLFFGSAPHFIAAKRLGTRGGLRRRGQQIGGRRYAAALGGGPVRNRGAFGALMATESVGRNGNVRKRAGKQALTTPRGLRAYAFHPGSKGDNQWPWTKRTAATRASDRWTRAHRQALLRSFK